MNEVLRDRYEHLCQGGSDIYEHLPTFVRTVRDLGATKVIELGVRAGVSTVAWLYALQDSGYLWSVDVHVPVPHDDGTELLEGFDDVLLNHWSFIHGNFTDPAVMIGLPEQVDAIFLDGNHVYEETLVELATFIPFVRGGGRFLLHDTAIYTTGNAITPQPPYPVRTAMEEFCADHGFRCENNPACNGLGVIYVP